MKKLTKDMIETKDDLIRRLDYAADDVKVAVRVYNDHNRGNMESIDSFLGYYHQLLAEANAFAEEIHDAQDDYKSSRSEVWQDSEKGGTYAEWVEQWSLHLEEISVDCNDDIEEPELEAADILRELPDMPK